MTLPTMSSHASLLELQLQNQKSLTSIVNALLTLLDLSALLTLLDLNALFIMLNFSALLSRLDHCMLCKTPLILRQLL